MILRFVYILFVGILLSLFVGFGISAFYEEPRFPESEVGLRFPRPVTEDTVTSTSSAEYEQKQIDNEKKYKEFQKELETYHRNVSIIGLSAAVIFLILSLALSKYLLLISDGLMLGGVFTILYSIVRGFESNDSKFQFIIVTIGLVIALVLGYVKFIKHSNKNNSY